MQLPLAGQNALLILGCALVWPMLHLLPKLDAKYSIVIGILGFAVAAVILTDFAKRGSAMPDNLGEAYCQALNHTAMHAAWPLALNVFFMLGFTALMKQFDSVPHVMACWLVAALIVPSIMDGKMFLTMGTNKAVALAGLIIAVVFLWRDGNK